MKQILSLTVCVCALAFLAETAVGQTTKTIYFVRHAEDDIALYQQGGSGQAYVPDCKPFRDGGVLNNCCTEELTPLGAKRAELLAQWMEDQGVLPSITQVLATHKIRTLQTVLPIAQAAGLSGDVDMNPGDGVQQIPPFVTECQDGYEVAHNFYPLIVDELRSLPLGSGVVVAGHSASLYPIMESFGIDTDSDPNAFPKNSRGRVVGYHNLWIVELDENNAGTLLMHLQMNFGLTEVVTP